MKAYYIMILLVVTVILTGWSYLHYQYQLSRDLKLRQLAKLPVYVYLADSTAVDSLSKELKEFPALASVKSETGLQAATELVNAYQLPLTESMLADYSFPNVVTLVFKPESASIPARKEVLKLLETKRIEPNDIDSQAQAWDLAEQDLKLFRNRWSEFTVFAAVLVLLAVVLLRLSMMFTLLLRLKGTSLTLLDRVRMHRSRLSQSLLLLFAPMLVNAGAYYLLVYFQQLRGLIDWIFFCVQFGALLAATLILLLLFNLLEHGYGPSEGLITVSNGSSDA
jgi:hypothetical protein